MLLFLNNTDKSFKVHIGKLKEGKQNRHALFSYENMNLGVFAADEHLEKIKKIISKTDGKLRTIDIPNTRLYFNNLHFRPIIVGDSRTKGTDTLLLAQKVASEERLVAVNHLDTAWVVESKRVKGEYIAAVISFAVDVPSAVEFVTTLDGKFIWTRYSSDGKGNISVEVTSLPVATVKDLDVRMRAGIKPYRPYRATHLVFLNEKDLNDFDNLLGTRNFHVVTFNNTVELNTAIAEYKSKGFTAATLFTSKDRNDDLTSMENSQLSLIVNNFKTAHLTYVDGYTKFKSLPPTPPVKKPADNERKFKK